MQRKVYATSTPSLGQAVDASIQDALENLFTAAIAVVDSYDRQKQTIQARLVNRKRFFSIEEGDFFEEEVRPITNIPVAFFQSGAYSITNDLQPGSYVLLVFSQDSLDEWKSGSGPKSTPNDPRIFDLTDAIAIPGISAISSPLPSAAYSDDSMVIRGPKIQLGSSSAELAVALAENVAQQVNAKIAAVMAAVSDINDLLPVPIPEVDFPVILGITAADLAATKVFAE